MAKILIIEDEPQISKLYATVLADKGHAVTTTSNANHGLQIIQKSLFDLIFLDLLMPVFSGIYFLRTAQPILNRTGTPVIALTNSESDKLKREAMELGVSRYLIKVDYSPYGLAQILEKELLSYTKK